MVRATDQRITLETRITVETIVAVIARSQIVLAALSACASLPLGQRRSLPAGFEEVDIAILDWIAAEGRHARRRYLPM
jgi:hypothetical protein